MCPDAVSYFWALNKVHIEFNNKELVVITMIKNDTHFRIMFRIFVENVLACEFTDFDTTCRIQLLF